jgi:hypothetical protein
MKTRQPLDPEALAQRAAARKRERHAKGRATASANTHRGKLLAWFAMQPTSALEEYKIAILQARKMRQQRNAARARAVLAQKRKAK